MERKQQDTIQGRIIYIEQICKELNNKTLYQIVFEHKRLDPGHQLFCVNF